MRHSILLAGAASALALTIGPATAQTGTGDPDIDYCRERTDDLQGRVACLEAAILSMRGTAGQQAAVAPQAPAAPSSESGAPAVVATAPDEPTGIGAEEVIRRQQKAGIRTADNGDDSRKRPSEDATVEEFAYNAHKKLILFLDNGQVWRQMSSDSVRVRLSKSRRHDVTITQGAMGSYRMTLHSMGRKIRVERIR